MADFITELNNRVSAGFGGIAVRTVEVFDLVHLLVQSQERLESIVLRMVPGEPMSLAQIDTVIEGTSATIQSVCSTIPDWQFKVLSQLAQMAQDQEVTDGMEYLDKLAIRLNASDIELKPGLVHQVIKQASVNFIVVLQNMVSEDTLKNPAVIQQLQRASYVGRTRGVTFLLQTPSGKVGHQLDAYYPRMDFKTPDDVEIKDIVSDIIGDAHVRFNLDEPVSDKVIDEVVKACRGLTRRQTEDIAALLLREQKYDQPDQYKLAKIATAENDNLFKVIDTQAKGDKLFGLKGLSDFAAPLLRTASTTNPEMRARGLLFAGPPGSGKTAAATMLAKQSKRTLCQVDLGSLRNKFVGETEARVDRMFELVDSLAPAILLVDEIEKSLDGAQSSGETDGGLGSRILGKFLTWAQDHSEDVLLIATANDVTKITDNFPEMLRAERFDAMFMFDLPATSARTEMWKYYLAKFKLDEQIPSQLAKMTDNWTGAEIRACCRLASLRGVPVKEQLSMIPYQYLIAKEVVTAVRRHANGKFIAADTGKIYKMKTAQTGESSGRRNVN